MTIPLLTELEAVRKELERTGRYKDYAAKQLYGRGADLNPAHAAKQAFNQAWKSPEHGEPLMRLVFPLLTARTVDTTVVSAANIGPFWVLEAAWARASDQARLDAFAEAARTRKGEHSRWMLEQMAFPQDALRKSLIEAVQAKDVAWARALFPIMDTPWKAMPALRARGAASAIAFLDTHWSTYLAAHPDRLPVRRFMSARLRRELPSIHALLREDALTQALPASRPSASRPRF